MNLLRTWLSPGGLFLGLLVQLAIHSACVPVQDPQAGGNNGDGTGNNQGGTNGQGGGTNGSGGGTDGGDSGAGGGDSGGGGGGGGSGGGGGAGPCVSDRVPAPSDQSCTCQWLDCEASQLTCSCSVECYAQQSDCLIHSDGSTSDTTLGSCNIECQPESDLSKDLPCSATECQPTPNSVSVNPTSNQPGPSASSMDAERDPVAVKVLFVVDNSGSMLDDQMAVACAMDDFFTAASAKGAAYETGVLTTDIFGDQRYGNYGEVCTNPTPMYNGSNDYAQPPHLVGLAGSCSSEPTCACGTGQAPSGEACAFNSSGDWLSSDNEASKHLLRQLIVQGQACSAREAGLEKAFQFFAEMERNGTFDLNAPHEIVFISDEDAFADVTDPDYGSRLCPFTLLNKHTDSIPNFNPPAQTGNCIQDLTEFYKYYFTSRKIIVNGIHFTSDCEADSTEQVGRGYQDVIAATSGQITSICHCESFPEFFQKVGARTSDLSTSICFPDGTDPDPSSIDVTYTENNASESVPHSSSDGWELDTSRNCLTFQGTWGDKQGSFHVDYVDRNAPLPPKPDPVACLDKSLDVLESSLAVTCDGATVPKSETNGWSFDSDSYCFTFHGDWAEATCQFKVQYF